MVDLGTRDALPESALYVVSELSFCPDFGCNHTNSKEVGGYLRHI